MNAPVRPLTNDATLIHVEAEMALIGAVLYENSAFNAAAHVRPEQFIEPVHQLFWSVISEACKAQRLAELVMLAEACQGSPALAELGGIRYIADLVDRAPPASTAGDYANLVVSNWTKRELIRLAGDATHAAATGTPASDVLAFVRRELDHLENEASSDQDGVTAHDAGDEVMGRIELEIQAGTVKGFKCGLSCIDRRLGGFLPESLVVIAGRPGMGKTALAGAALNGAAYENPSRLFAIFSVEMSKRQLIERSLSRLTADDDAPIAYEKIGKNNLIPMELERLHEVKRFLPRNLMLFDTSSISVDDVRRRVWALKRRGDLAAIAIDYLQIMRRPRADGRNEASVIGEMTAALKQLAREAKICIVLLSQLSRAVESLEDKRPQLSHLRESGSIEQDADAVIFPFREVYYLERAEPREGTPEHTEWEVRVADLRRRMDAIVAKNRHGSVGTELQEYDPEFDRFQNWRGKR